MLSEPPTQGLATIDGAVDRKNIEDEGHNMRHANLYKPSEKLGSIPRIDYGDRGAALGEAEKDVESGTRRKYRFGLLAAQYV